ncbi:ester cyclase [Dactylosporangium matsuzakiense]|nr:ester cyclase [Dactylosporangium matsuzakiense]
MQAGELDDFQRLVHPKAVNREDVVEPPAARVGGPEAFLASAHWLRGAFSDLRFVIEDAAADGDLTILRVTMSGRHTGPFVVYGADARVDRVFAPTGRSFAVHQTHWQRIRDGRVIEHWADRDDQGMAMQAGWIPPSPLYLIRCARATARARRDQANRR